MIIDAKYWTSVFKRILYVLLIFIGLIASIKLSVFYMPFLIAFIISLIIEPLIKKMMKKTHFTRRTSAIIIFSIVAVLILGLLTWGILTLFSETSNLLLKLNEYFDKAYDIFTGFSTSFDFSKIHLPNELKSIIQDSAGTAFSSISNWATDFFNGLINMITSIPVIAIYFGITIVALYFICVDKIYILDQIEHHLPKMWVKKLGRHFRDLIKTLGCYLKAEATLVLVSFIISLIGLYTYKIIGFNIEYPLLIAIFIGFVDALPILGSGTVMVPWAIICAIDGNIKLALAILFLLVIMSIVRQFMEPKLVSKHIGVHPIFTLIAMYTGFKFIGIMGLIIGPIILIIFKNVFATFIDKGVIKTIFDKK